MRILLNPDLMMVHFLFLCWSLNAITFQGDNEATVHHLPHGILEQVLITVGVVTTSFKNGGEEGREDRERQVVGVHHLHALISLEESAIVEVHAGFYM